MARLGRSSPIQTRVLRRAAVAAGQPKTETLIDTFDTQVNPAVWALTGTGAWSAGQAGLTELNGDYSMYTSVADYDLTDSSVYAKVTPPTTVTDATEAYLAVKLPGRDQNGLYTIAYWGSGPAAIWLVFRERRNGANSEAWLLYDPVAHAYFRIRSVGQTVYWDTSPDGTTWTNRRSMTTLLTLTGNKVELAVGQWAARATHTTGYFDNINTVPAAVTSRPKVTLDGSTFVKKPGKVWTGSAWVEKPWKVWTGSTWKTLT